MSKIESVAISLAKSHVNIESHIERVVWFPAENEDKIQLIEVSRNAIPIGAVCPFSFARTKDVQYQTFIADVTVDEWDKICDGKIKLPQGWSLKSRVDVTP